MNIKNMNYHLYLVELVILLTKCKKSYLCQVDWRVYEDFLTNRIFFPPQSFRILRNGCSTGHIIFTCPSIKMSWIWNDLKQLFKGHHGLTIKGHVGVFSVGLFGLKWRNWRKTSKTEWILCKGKCASIQNISTGRQSFSKSYMLKIFFREGF